MADETTKVIRIVIDSSKAVEGGREAQRALEAIEKQTKETGASLARMESGLDAAALIVKLTAGVAVVKTFVDRLTSVFNAARDAAAGIKDFSEQLGLNTDFIQGSMHAAAQSTVSVETLGKAYQKATQTIGQASQGQKQAIETFQSLGVKILDASGKLRNSESILTEAAGALVKMDDPAKRLAATMDLFGKSGAQLVPMLSSIAQGSEAMATKARLAGAIMEKETLEQLAKLKAQSEETALKWNALVANLGAPIATESLSNFNKFLGDVIENLRTANSLSGFLDNALEKSRREGRIGSGPNALRLATPEEMEQYRREQAQKGLSDPNGAGREWIVQEELNRINRDRDQRALNRQATMASEEEMARRGGGIPANLLNPGGSGSRNPTAVGGGGGGESPEQKYAKLTIKMQEAARAQDIMTAAARQGGVAFDEAKVHLDAIEKTLEIFGKRLADNDPRLVELEARMLRIARGKAAEAFNVATNELQQQNELLEKQIELMGQSPDLIAKEVAMIKAKNEAAKAGKALTDEDIQARQQAIETNERLKLQQDELRKAQELWTEPMKQALQDIQRIGADAFDQLLESGKFSFESLAQTFGRIVRRMAAEFLALATIRPVMSVLVQSVGGEGFARQMGLGGGTTNFSLGGTGGGGFGGGSLFGGGSGFLGGVGDWLNTPLTGPYAGMSPSSMAGVPMLSPSMMNPSSWGITALQGIGAAAGAGMGIMQLINSKSAASTIGGISSIVGAGVSLIPGFGQIAGPLIALAGNLLPGLFGLGESNPTITNQTYGQLSYGSGGWYTTGGAWGPSANASQTQQGLAALGGNISNVFGLLGGVKDPSKVWGLSAQSKNVSGKDWSSDSLSTFLVDPSGNQQLWRMNEGNMMDTGSAQVAYRSILEGAVGDITENMRSAVLQVGQTMGGTSLQAIAETIAEVKAFDDTIANLGKTTSGVEQALAQIDEQFAAIYATADKYGFATGAVDAAKQAERLKYAMSFADSIQRGINDFSDPNINKLADLDKWRTDSIEANNAILKNVTGSLDQINKIEELYALQRQQIVEGGAAATAESLKRMTEQSVATIQAAIERLTLGDLANLSPTAAYAGQRASYTAMLAQARAGDANALAGIAGAGTNLAEIGRTYFASGPEYEALRQQIVADLSGFVTATPGGSGGLTTNENVAQMAALVQTMANENTALRADLKEVTDLLKRYVVNQ